MAIIEARKRMAVTGLDISEQPASPYILMYNDLPFAIDHYEVSEGTLYARLNGVNIVSFNARRSAWIVINRTATKIATKEEIAAAQADLQKLQEEMLAKHHPEEYRAYTEQRRRQLGLGSGRDPGNYL